MKKREKKFFLCGTEHFLSNYFHKAPPTLLFLLLIFPLRFFHSLSCVIYISYGDDDGEKNSKWILHRHNFSFPSFFFFCLFFCSYFSIILLLSIHLLKKIMYIKAYLYMWMCHKFIIKVNERSQMKGGMGGGC